MVAENEYHFYEPALGHNLTHDPLNAIVAPRPIGWISSCDREGRLNLAPYSFFNAFNYKPPILGFASTGRKDSLRNVQETGEFVWNLATRPLAEAMNQTSATVPHGINEFDLAGLAPTPSRLVRPPWVAKSPVAMECKCTQIVQLQAVDGRKIETWLVLGEVVAVHILKSALKDGVYDTAAMRPVVRAGRGGDYFEITAATKFEMKRPS
jgi:flavin reductase (DIM6/NTAB) family NADH-FMN oxidoreductase RutF